MEGKKKFSLGQILTVYTGFLMCEMGKVYELLDFLTQDKLFTHQLPRAREECSPWMCRWMPWLEEIQVPKLKGMEEVKEFIEPLYEKYGEFHELEPIPRDDHEIKDPMKELEEMVGSEKIVEIKVNKEGD